MSDVTTYTGRCTYCGRVLELRERPPHYTGEEVIREVKFTCSNPLNGVALNACTVTQWDREIK